MHQHFTAEQFLPYPVETVFTFFANPENLPRLMPKWQRARIEQAPFARHPSVTHAHGAPLHRRRRRHADYSELPPVSLTPPCAVTWLAAINHFIWNEQFCDTQLDRPLFFWHHCHKVRAHGPQAAMKAVSLASGQHSRATEVRASSSSRLTPVSRVSCATPRSRESRALQFRGHVQPWPIPAQSAPSGVETSRWREPATADSWPILQQVQLACEASAAHGPAPPRPSSHTSRAGLPPCRAR